MRILAILFIFTVCGCYKSDYQRPKIDFSELEKKEEVKSVWLEIVEDKSLTKLLKKALQRNLDIKEKRANLQKYMARIDIAAGKLRPDFDLRGSGAYNKVSLQGLQGLNPFMQRYYNQYDVGAGLNWEIDLFGRLAKNHEAAKAIFAAKNLELRDLENKIAGQIVKEYVVAANLVQRFAVLRDKYYNQQRLIDLDQSLFESGVINKNEVNNEKIALNRQKNDIVALKFQINESFYRIDRLLAQNMGTTRKILNFSFAKRGHLNVKQFEKAVDRLLNSQIIENHPLILAKEQDLIAANARVGIAKTQYFPKFTFSASGGLQSINSRDIVSSRAITSNAGLSFSWRILDFLKINNEIKEAKAERKEYLIAYKKAVLEVFFEIENAANKIIKTEDNIDFGRKILKLRQKNINLAKSDYDAGLSNYSSVILAKNNYYDARILLLKAKGENLEAVVEFFDALN